MLPSACPKLKGLSKLLREKHDVRNRMIVCGFPNTNLLRAEYDLIRIQRIITRHRRRCQDCKLQDNFSTLSPIRLRPLPSEASIFPVDMMS